jgi:hypothetical protein
MLFRAIEMPVRNANAEEDSRHLGDHAEREPVAGHARERSRWSCVMKDPHGPGRDQYDEALASGTASES